MEKKDLQLQNKNIPGNSNRCNFQQFTSEICNIFYYTSGAAQVGSAGIGLIFTVSQESAQQGRLTQTGHPCDTMLGFEWGSWPGKV